MNSNQTVQSIQRFLSKTSDLLYTFEVIGEANFIIVEVNENFEKEFGITASQCIGKRPQDLLGNEVASLVNANLERCVQESRTLEGIVEMDTPHGKQVYQTTFVPLCNKAGSVTRILTVKRRVNVPLTNTDSLVEAGDYRSSLLFPMHTMQRVMGFSDLNTLKTEVEQREKQVRELAELAPYGIVTLEDLQPVFANRSLLKLAGVDTFEAYIKKGLLCFIHPKDRQYVRRLYYQAGSMKPLDKHQQTVTGINASGELRQLDIRFVRNEQSLNQYTQIVVFDITDVIEKEKNKAQIVSLSLGMNQCNENKAKVKKELEHVIAQHHLNPDMFRSVFQLMTLVSSDRDELSQFLDCFDAAHPDFLIHLKSQCPTLTLNEIKHCACIRMRCQTKDIARLFNIHPTSVQKARVRLKKKLGLDESQDLREWIESV